MKGQFALFEVFLSSLALSALVSLLACILYTYPSVTGAYNFNYGNLLYDFTNADRGWYGLFGNIGHSMDTDKTV